MKHFGKPFPSDNTRQMMNAIGGNVSDYYETPPAADLLQHTRAWIAGLVLHKAPTVLSSFYGSIAGSTLPVFLAAVLVLWGVTHRPLLPAPALRFTVLGLVLIPVMLLPAVLVGYGESRYHTGPLLLLFCMLLAVLVSFDPAAWERGRATILLLLVAALPLKTVFVPLAHNRMRLLSPARAMAPVHPTEQMQQVTDAVRRDSAGQPHRLILTTGYIASAKYGALTGEPTTVMPRLETGSFAAFARDWHVTHVYNPPKIDRAPWEPAVADPASYMRTINSPGVELVPLDLPGLYRIRLTP
jgi:hypothetical protein